MKIAPLALVFSLSIVPTVHSHPADVVSVERVVSVYDGDTLRVDIDNPHWPAIVRVNMPVRINNIDTPEIRGECEQEKAMALKARDALRALLESAQSVHLENLKRGKYFRFVADVYADQVNIAEYLTKQGLAKPYMGGKKEPWCL